MPAKDFSVRDWVAELMKDQNIPEDRRKVVEEVLASDAVAARVRDGVLRQADYSRQTQELAEQRQAIEAGLKEAQGKYQASYGSLAQWKADQQKFVDGWKAELVVVKAREERLAEAVAKAKAQGLDDKDLGLDGQPLPAHRTEEPVTPKYVTPEQLTQERQLIGKAMTDFTPGLLDIYTQHNVLFPGQPLNMKALVEEASRQGSNVQEVWAKQYKVGDRINEIHKENLDKQLQESRDAGLKEGREAALREMQTGHVMPGTPGGRPTTLGPVFHVEDIKAQMAAPDSVGKTGNPVMDAVEAYRTNKYTPKSGAAA